MAARTNGTKQRNIPDSPDERREKSARLDSLGRLPPQNEEAECGVLAGILYDPSQADLVAGRLDPDDFYSEANRQIFIAINNVHAAGRKVDIGLVVDRLTRFNMLEAVGGVAYLMEVVESAVHAGNTVYYADLVREYAMRRRLIHAATDCLRDAYDETTEIRKVATNTETKLADIAAHRDASALTPVCDAAAEMVHAAKKKASQPREERKTGVKSSLWALRELLGNYERQQVTLVAARTSVGKTSFVTSEIAHWLEHENYVGYFCSLEMHRVEVVEKIVCAATNVDSRRFREGYCGPEEIALITDWTKEFAGKKLYIDDAPERTVNEILAMARRVKRQAGRLDYVVLDYIQLVEWDGDKYAKRHEQVSKISRAIKIGARLLDVPMIVLCQLNREAAEGRPKLSHLRESGALEQDADKVLFIDRQTEGSDADTAAATLICAKNRFGRTGECQAAFFGGWQKFADMAQATMF